MHIENLEQLVGHRYWSHVEVRGPDECWPWTARLASHGYAVLGYVGGRGGRSLGAHVIAYLFEYGSIPDGYVIDHECHNADPNCPGGVCPHRSCCNPRHLVARSQRDNTVRGKTRPAANLAKTHCPRGHEYTVENTYLTKSGARDCRTCHREDQSVLNHRNSARRRRKMNECI